MTKAIVDIAAPLGISGHDHIIVGKNRHAQPVFEGVCT
jgi:DNA repair protein RadC